MHKNLPTACNRSTKCNAQGDQVSWNGYQFTWTPPTVACPLPALLSSVSMHDSRAAFPLWLMSAERVTHLYDLRDAACGRAKLREHSRSLVHVPLIDHHPRGGKSIMVKGCAKVMGHLMFGVLALSADQLMRWRK